MALTRHSMSTEQARASETSTSEHGGPRKPRGRPRAGLDAAELTRLRDELGMSWRKIGKKLGTGAPTARRAYFRTHTTARVYQNSPTPYQNSTTGIPENGNMEDCSAEGPLGSVYVRQNTADRLELNQDGSFVLEEAGRTYRGTFLLVLKSPELSGGSAAATIQGDEIVDQGGCAWVRADRQRKSEQS